MHLVSTFPFSLLRPCFLIWAYHVYIYIYFLYFIPYFVQLSRLFKKVLSVQRGFLCFYSYQIWQKKERDLNKQLHSRIIYPVIFHTGLLFFSFFCKGSICVYLCPTVSCILSGYFILFHFICKKQFVQVLQIIWTFVVLSNFKVIIVKSVLAVRRWIWSQRGFCTKYFLLISLVISLVTLACKIVCNNWTTTRQTVIKCEKKVT